jgi:hypothetical protein
MATRDDPVSRKAKEKTVNRIVEFLQAEAAL